MSQEKCEYCDGVVEPAIALVPFKYKQETVYIDHVPVRRCSRCGEIYYEAEVYKRLEMIAENRGAITTQITFPLADYAMTEPLRA